MSGLYVFTCPLGDDDFEVTARIRPTAEQDGSEPVSWGHPFDLHKLLHEYEDFCRPVKQILHLAAEGEVQEFACFSGPRLNRIVSHGSIAFIGDSSHPMSGNFGSGAALALEDAYTLAKVLDWAWTTQRPLADALELFNSIRSPHYARLYQVLDKYASIKAALQAENLPVDEDIAERVRRISLASDPFMYYYEIDKVVDAALREAEKCF
jgi:salicylate hydroxylase